MRYQIPHKVKVVSPVSKYRGLFGVVTMVYHDVYHKGDGTQEYAPDYYYVRLENGRTIGGLSHHFEVVEEGPVIMEHGSLPPDQTQGEQN